MDNQNPSDSTKAPVPNGKRDWLVWVLTYPQRYLQQRRADRQKENATDRAARSTARATWAIAALTIAMIGIGALQWSTLHDTDKSIAGQLREMQAEQRPWVYATEVKIAGRIVLADGRYVLPLKITATNTGHLPAFFVQYKTGAAPLRIGGPSTHTVKNDVCDDYRNNPNRSGQTVFAGQTVTYGGFTIDDYPSFPQAEWDALKADRLIVLYGCIDYQFPDQPGHHQSRFSFAVGRRNDVGILTRIGSLPDDPATVEPHMLPVTIGDDGPPAD